MKYPGVYRSALDLTTSESGARPHLAAFIRLADVDMFLGRASGIRPKRPLDAECHCQGTVEARLPKQALDQLLASFWKRRGALPMVNYVAP